MAYIPIDIFKVSKDLNTLNSSFLSPTQGLSSLDHDMLLLTSDPSSNSVDSFNMYFKQGIKSIVNIGSSYVVDASKSSNAISYKIAPEITFTDWTALKADKAKVVVNGNWRNLLNDYGEKDILVRDLNENDFSDVDWTTLLKTADVSVMSGETETLSTVMNLLQKAENALDTTDRFIAQETGTATDKAISQKVETDIFTEIKQNTGISQFSELTMGTNYSAGDVVKYNDLLYFFTASVTSIALTETIEGWPLKTYNGNTYKCTRTISAYSASTTYTNGQMALKDGVIKIYNSADSSWTAATLAQVASYEGNPIKGSDIVGTYIWSTSIYDLHKIDVIKVIHLINPKTYVSAYLDNNNGGALYQRIGIPINAYIYSTEYLKSFTVSGTSQAGEACYDIAFYSSTSITAASFISGKYYYSGGPTKFSETFTVPSNAVCFGITDTQHGNIKISDIKLRINEEDMSETFKDEMSAGSYKLKYGNSINMPYNFTAGKKVTFFGDSIPAGVASTGPDTRTDLTTTHYPYLFAKKYGMILDNQCDSGDRILGNTQYSIIPNITSYTASTDFIFVHAGINDYGGASPLGVLGDTTNTTVYGSLYIICEYFKAHYSSVPITFITPINHWRVLTGAVSPLNAYRNAIFEMATKYGFNVVDGSKIGFPDVYDDTPYKSVIMADGLHPTELGHSMLFKSLCGILGDNSNLIVQTTGTATDMVMSQKAVTDAIGSVSEVGEYEKYALIYAGRNVIVAEIDLTAISADTTVTLSGVSFTVLKDKAVQVFDFGSTSVGYLTFSDKFWKRLLKMPAPLGISCVGRGITAVSPYLDVSRATSLSYFLYYAPLIASLDTSHWETGKVTSMSYMFQGCTLLSAIDVSNFDTRNVTNMDNMFSGDLHLEQLDLTHFNTAKVTSLNSMFYSCRKLTSLDLSSFDTRAVTSMASMFQYCVAITKLTLSANFFNSTAITTYLFDGLTAWTDADSLATLVEVIPTTTTAKTIALSTATKAALTDAQKLAITNKGWTIA